MTGPMVYGGGGRAATAQPYLTAILAAAAGTLTATTGFDRTIGNQFCYAAPTLISGARAEVLYSGSGTDAYTVKCWVGGVLKATATLSITAGGCYAVTFSAPIAVPAYTTVTLGIRCTSSSRYAYSATGSSTYFAAASAVRLAPPCVAEPGRFITRFGTYRDGDGEPVTDVYAANNNVAPIDPVTLSSATTAGLVWDGDSILNNLVQLTAAQNVPALAAPALSSVPWYAVPATGGKRLDEITSRFAGLTAPWASVPGGAILVFDGGINDALQNTALTGADVYARWARYVTEARAAGFKRIVFLGMLSITNASGAPGSLYETTRAAFNVLARNSGLVDLYVDPDVLTLSRNADALHPDAAGNVTLAAAMASAGLL